MSTAVIQSTGLAAGGGDVTPDAVNWGNLIAVGGAGSGYAANSEQAITGINSPIQLRATWTSSSSSPARGAWARNGVPLTDYLASPVSVNTSISGDVLSFMMTSLNTEGVGNYDTGTVTVTNESDGGASLDTFTFAIQYVPS